MVSAFKYQKGHKFMLEAFKEFLNTNNEYRLILVGEGALKEEMRRYCFNNALDKKVDFLGYLTSDELVELYNQTEVFVLPSLWEGFPKVLLEAMSCGCKVICTKVDGAVKVLNKEYEYFINIKDSKGIVEALLRIIEDDNYNYNMQSDIAKKYNWTTISLPYIRQFELDLKKNNTL